VAREIHQIEEASDKATALTRQLLALSRRQLLRPRNIALNAVVTGIETMLRRVIGENMEVVFCFPPDLGTVYADPSQIEQVILNLAVNARDAMPDGGNLHFEGRNLDLVTSYAERGFEIPPGRYILLEVADTGTGITPENLDRIFEPFFTTKEVGRGTGLGLSTVYGIVKQSGGNIGVSSVRGRGTTFKIYLPRVDRPVDSLDQQEQPPVVKPGSETILLVEDDPGVRQLANSILGAKGYRVLAPEHPSEAEQVSAQHSGPIDLLLTDLVMPDISGPELARRVVLRRPKIKVLYMSGYTDDSTIHRRVAEETVAFIAKPFTPTSLQGKVREVLDGAQLLPK
jgi:CheY-like chemotaxis protein